MSGSRFVYVTYIRTTPAELWDALLNPEVTGKYWFGIWFESTWENGAAWQMYIPDGRITNAGRVVDVEPGKRLVLAWHHEINRELKAEADTRCTLALEPAGDDAVKLTLVHEAGLPNSKTIDMVSGSWPKVFASLKSFLETGEALSTIHRRAGACGEAAAANDSSPQHLRLPA